MSERRKLHQHDDDHDIPTKHFQPEDDETDEESEIPSTKQRQNGGINEIVEDPIKKSKVQNTSAYVSSDIIGMIDTFDRPFKTTAESGYAKKDSYASGFENKPGKRIPKATYIAEAGYGRARIEASVLEAKAKGPNASFGAEASVAGVRAMAQAEVASASAKAGPVGVKVGLGFDTGASVGADGVEVKFLGTGISIGPKTSVSVLGSEASCSVM
ncbi:hypothetical protein ROHU_032073 [Labeo rohita]|uniref:Uncharacterized protein n=1 Tax=Labeo rohita TaxID=84645 RepID=A0A498LK31_LABRO|nr:uncharacterized protein LOC127173183 [Labeo rohita]RXN07873.1 hypothetical protein ROHU_032073 [Labeo rohita]